MSHRSRILAAVGAGLVLSASAGLWLRVAGRAQTPLGVVVITLDTTRADRLSPYNFMDISLPHLERLAREGTVFEQAATAAPLTLPAHTSLFTGLLPPHHGVRDNADARLADDKTTLAEILSSRGFRTAAFVGSVVLNPDRGLSQGFQQYRGVPPPAVQTRESLQRRASGVIDDAIGWLDGIGDSRFFLWTHLYDPHRPYDPPEPYRTLYGHDPYLGEIAYADSQVGRLLDALERRHLLDRTMVIVTADHGESLGGHGERDHGIFVYQDVVHVPLIVRTPGVRPSRVEEVVRLTDVMPTILEILDIPRPPMDGVSLRELMTGGRSDLALDAYAESLYPERLGWSALRSLRSGRFKLIEAPRPELYDLQEDPFEERNVYDQRPAETQALKSRLAGIAAGRGPGSADVSPGLKAQLSSLGYVTSAPANQPGLREAPPDPKDCIRHGCAGSPPRPAASRIH